MRDIFRIWRKFTNNVNASIGGVPVELRILDNPADREKGFMFEPEPDDGFGLFFVHPKARSLGFWMRNVPFDLDLVILDDDMRIKEILQLKANDESTILTSPTRYAIELASGWCERNGVGRGDRLDINERYDEQLF